MAKQSCKSPDYEPTLEEIARMKIEIRKEWPKALDIKFSSTKTGMSVGLPKIRVCKAVEECK